MNDHAKKLITAAEKTLSELREEIDRLRLKKRCPFWPVFALESSVNGCIYMGDNNTCEDLETCPGNSDAWCFEQIDQGITLTGRGGKPDITELVEKFEAMLTEYSDLCCDKCELCES